MRRTTSLRVSLASFGLLLFVGCTGDVGTTCFQDDECNSGLECCHVGSPFTQGTCQTPEACVDMGGGTGGTGGQGAGGQGGVGGQGAGGVGGSTGVGGSSGGGGSPAAGGSSGVGGASGAGGA